MVRLSLHNAGIGWHVREHSIATDVASTWSFFSRSQALDFLSTRYQSSNTSQNSRIELEGVCFSELSFDGVPSEL